MKPSVLFSRLAVLLISGMTVVSAQTLELTPAERLPTPVVDPASDEAELAIKHFTLPAGLQARLWAAEPMLANPVAFDFDEKGRLFVSETHRYHSSVLDIRNYMPMLEMDLASRTIEDRSKLIHTVFAPQAKDFAIESEIVRLVEDTDGDGVADKSSIFADGFNSELDGIASGVLARHGKVWFTNIPSLWLLTEQPNAKPKREELLRGFGVRFNFTGHDFHGLAIGPDGKLYFSIGDRGAHVKGPDGRVIDVPDDGAVYRSNFDGTGLELVHRGLRNPQELVFDERGDLFTGDNDSDQGDMERLVHVVEGGDSGWRIGYQFAPLGKGGPWMSDNLWKPRFPDRPAYLLPPICNIEDGPSGLTYYPGTGLTPAYAGHFFITHFKGSIARSGIQTYTLGKLGASYKPTSSELFMGGVLPTDVTFAPDGKLYLLDWVDGWPKSRKGRVYSVSPVTADPAQAKVSADLAKLLAKGFKDESDASLGKLLAHPDRRARLEAQLELASRGKKSVGVFTRVAKDKSAAPLARLHAVWGLTQLGESDPKVASTLLGLLGDPDSEVRAQAAKGLGAVKYATAPPALVKALEDTEPRVQFFAAQSLGKLGDADSVTPLLALLKRNDNQDEYLRHAAVHALARIGNNPTLDAAATDSSAAVRLGVLLAYRELANAKIATFLADQDAFIAREAALAINDAPVKDAAPALAASLAKAPVADEPFVVRAINANYRVGGDGSARNLAQFAERGDATPAMRAEALRQLGLWAQTPQRDRVVGIFRPMAARGGDDAAAALTAAAPKLLGKAPDDVQVAAIEAVASLKIQSLAPQLTALVGNNAASEPVRAAALKSLDTLGGDEITRALALAEKSNVPALRLATLEITARRAPERAMPIVSRFVAEGSEPEQQAAFRAIPQLPAADGAKLLVGSLDRLAAGKVAPGAQVELLDAVEKSTAPAVQARWEKQKAAWAASGDDIAPYRSALAGGNPWAGAGQFFNNDVVPCARCHKVYGNGGEAGPDLSTIGKQKSAEYLLESIVLPSKHIAAGFDIVTFTLKNGNTETGSIVSETPQVVVLKRGDNTTVDIATAQVQSRVAAPSSMPDIYTQVMSRAELRNVVAFLKALDGSQSPLNEPAAGTTNRAMSSTSEVGAGGGHP